MGLASIRSRVKRIERALRVPASAADTRPMIALLTLLAGDDGLWREWIALSAGGAAVGLSLFSALAARINAADAADTAAGGADPCALRVGGGR